MRFFLEMSDIAQKTQEPESQNPKVNQEERKRQDSAVDVIIPRSGNFDIKECEVFLDQLRQLAERLYGDGDDSPYIHPHVLSFKDNESRLEWQSSLAQLKESDKKRWDSCKVKSRFRKVYNHFLKTNRGGKATSVAFFNTPVTTVVGNGADNQLRYIEEWHCWAAIIVRIVQSRHIFVWDCNFDQLMCGLWSEATDFYSAEMQDLMMHPKVISAKTVWIGGGKAPAGGSKANDGESFEYTCDWLKWFVQNWKPDLLSEDDIKRARVEEGPLQGFLGWENKYWRERKNPATYRFINQSAQQYL